MRALLRQFAPHPFFFASYPILALLAHNIREVPLRSGVRPLVLSWVITAMLYLLIRWTRVGTLRAALLLSLGLVLFFSYGHVYELLQAGPIPGLALGRHRYLLVIYALLLAVGSAGILKWRGGVEDVTLALNLAGAVLILLPCVQFLEFEVGAARAGRFELVKAQPLPTIPLSAEEPLPDIYYIILDTYTRADALSSVFDFDNTAFLNELVERGFYVAECSRPNYGYTQASLAAALNMNYLPELQGILAERGLEDDLWVLIKKSAVRGLLESIGYKTIAFETGYKWTELTAADIYLGLGRDAIGLQVIQPFEALFLKTTAALLITDLEQKSRTTSMGELLTPLQEVAYSLRSYVEGQMFILNTLASIADIEGPSFTFVHLLIPHVPRVFDPQGGLLTDPGFYSGRLAGAINDEYDRLGYLSEIQFINAKMLEIIDAIQPKSEVPPVIIIQGDTGHSRDNLYQILNAYYVGGRDTSALYPTITPVNSFRLVFNSIFGTDYALHPDITYGDSDLILAETSPACLE